MPFFRLTLRALPGEPAAAVRIRRALKVLLRSFRLRCVALEELEPGEKARGPPGRAGGARATGHAHAARIFPRPIEKEPNMNNETERTRAGARERAGAVPAEAAAPEPHDFFECANCEREGSQLKDGVDRIEKWAGALVELNGSESQIEAGTRAILADGVLAAILHEAEMLKNVLPGRIPCMASQMDRLRTFSARA